MRKSTLLSAFLALLVTAGVVWSAPRARYEVTRTSRNDGNTRVGISAQCSSGGWTTVVSQRKRRRMLKLVPLPTNTATICLATEASGSCVNGAFGPELGTTTVYEDNNEAAVYCRSRVSDQTLKGFDAYDSGDVEE